MQFRNVVRGIFKLQNCERSRRVKSHILFLPSPHFDDSGKTEKYKPWFDPNDADSENERAKRAYESVLTVTASSSNTAEYEEFSSAVKELSAEKFNYSYEGEVTTFVANFHDAVIIELSLSQFLNLDWEFHNSRTSKFVDQQILCCSEMPIDGFWGYRNNKKNSAWR